MKSCRTGIAAGATGLLIASPAVAQLGGAVDSGPSLWRITGAILICLILAVVGALALKARSGGATTPLPWLKIPDGRRLQLVESIRLTPQVQLSIVACGDREMLIATSPGGAQLLGDVPVPRPAASASDADA